MTFFNASEPILRRKQHELDFQDLQGLQQFRWRVGSKTLLKTSYSRIDQVFLLWGLLTAAMFVTAQFLPLDWSTQAALWTVLTLIGTVAMIGLSWFWVVVERVTWLVSSWVLLIVGGLALTDYSIFTAWGDVMLHLGSLWLVISALGYVITGCSLRSRALVLAGIVHLFSAAVVFYICDWQFLLTGIVMAGSLLLLGESQWDMRPPIDYRLSEAQKQFNREQHSRRSASHFDHDVRL